MPLSRNPVKSTRVASFRDRLTSPKLACPSRVGVISKARDARKESETFDAIVASHCRSLTSPPSVLMKKERSPMA